MFGASIGRAGQRIIDAMVRWLARGHINPNILTSVGVAINVGSGLLFGFGQFFWAGIVLIVANLFDMLDGQVARLSGRVTSFGGFLDSSLDRLSDMERSAFVLRHFEGRTIAEISRTLGVKSGAAKNCVFRAVAKLRRDLGPLVEASR